MSTSPHLNSIVQKYIYTWKCHKSLKSYLTQTKISFFSFENKEQEDGTDPA
jgi:hypothetical protein